MQYQQKNKISQANYQGSSKLSLQNIPNIISSTPPEVKKGGQTSKAKHFCLFSSLSFLTLLSPKE